MSTSRKRAEQLQDRHIWSFFTGGMGLDLGFESVGLEPTLANEIDPHCCATIRLNRPDLPLLDCDIAGLTVDNLRERSRFDGDVFLMIGGPPCQSFSSGGKRAALSDPRGNLIYEYLRLVSEVRPRYFVLENVANLTTAALQHRPIADRPGKHWSLKRYDDGGADAGVGEALSPDERSSSAIRRLLQDVNELGYYVTFGVLNSADYGAPQKRLRFVMIGSRDHPPPQLPVPTHGTGPGLIPYQTVRNAIWSLQNSPGMHSQYTEAVARYFAMVPEGGNWRHLPPAIQREALGGSYAGGGGKTGFYRRLSWDGQAPTIIGRANRKGSALCHPTEIRPLSVRECAALQGFPADWEFVGSMNAQYMQIGNAVPLHLGAAIASSVLKHDSAKKSRTVWKGDFDLMLDAALVRLRAAARNKRDSMAA